MAAAIDVSVAAVATAVTSLTTGSISPSGSNRYIFGASTTQGQNTTDMKYGGSGGTALTEVGTTGSFGFGLGDLSSWGVAPGPTGSTTAYGAFAASTFAAIGAICLTGVDQTTPLGTEVKGADDVFVQGPVTASLTLTGIGAGKLVVGVLGVIDAGGAGIVSIVAGSGTTIEASALAAGGATGEQRASIAMLSGVADGSGNLTLSATITMTSAGTFLSYQIAAFPVNDATSSGVTATPGTGAVAITGAAPTVQATSNRTAQPDTGAVAITGAAPTVQATDNRTAQPDTGAVAITGQTPAVVVGDNQVAQPGTGAVAITGQIPTVEVTANQVVQPDAGEITITGAAPSVAGVVVATPGVGTIGIQGYAPEVLNTTSTDSLLDAKYQGNVKFKPYREPPAVIEPMLPAQITNMPGAMPPPARRYGLLQVLDDTVDDYSGARLEVPASAPAIKPVPKPKKPAPRAAETQVEAAVSVEAAPPPAPDIEKMMSAFTLMVDRGQEALAKQLEEVNAAVKRLTQLQARMREHQLEIQVDEILARGQARRARNMQRAEEITQRLLDS